MYRVGLEDLAMNAFSVLESQSVRLETLYAYGKEVVKYLREHGEEAELVGDKERTVSLLRSNPGLFAITDLGSKDTRLWMRIGVTSDDLMREFIGGCTFPLLEALNSEKALKILKDDLESSDNEQEAEQLQRLFETKKAS